MMSTLFVALVLAIGTIGTSPVAYDMVSTHTGVSIEQNAEIGLTEVRSGDYSVVYLDVQPLDYSKMND